MTKSILYSQQRRQVAETALYLNQSGLVVNTSGNVSLRIGEHIIITPSGKSYQSLSNEDICVLNLNGEWIDGELLPSSETPLHLAAYNSDSSIQALVHTHSVHATAASTLVDTLPLIHYQMVDLGGIIPVAPYATFGSQKLADSVMSVMPGKTAILMKNHGSITTGHSLDKALARTITLEWCCEVWLKAAAVGNPSLLNEDQASEVKSKMSEMEKLRSNPEKFKKQFCTCDELDSQ
jgi:L-fuculose-phosphate aldolase